MAILTKRLTDSVARAVAPPPTGYTIHWCPRTPGFGVRVSSNGDRAYVSERKVDGRTTRRTLGKAAGAKAISADAARQLQVTISGELQAGVDRAALKRKQRAEERAEAVTVADAVREYVKHKRREKDGLALKQRTKDDYLRMVEPGGTRADGAPFADGPLYCLADKSIHKITADDVRHVYTTQLARGQRQAVYSMQVLRAVLNWHGVMVKDSPLAKSTAGRDRIVLPGTVGRPQPIPHERLGAWWRAACAIDTVSADQLRFALLTGLRPGEAAGLVVGNVDLVGGRAVLRDTKNRKDHTLVLARQAAEILRKHIEGKRAAELVFGIADPGKTIATINEAADTPGVSAHRLRHTFASIADDACTAATVRVMLNHASADVAQENYIGIAEDKLRAGWQAVADFIEARATL